MIHSMTGFASAKGELAVYSWGWELRSVNGKGLDLRVRVPDWLPGLETALRSVLSGAVTRGNVTLSLRIHRADEAGALSLNRATLDAMLQAMVQVEAAAQDYGVALDPPRATDFLALRGVLDTSGAADDSAPLIERLKTEFTGLVEAFLQMRQTEGETLRGLLIAQLGTLEELIARAANLAEARRDGMAENLRTNLARVMDNADGADPDRVAQELALIAVKADVTEEIDRLGAHIQAARDLLEKGGAVGRKLDFLMQEFNREANTLCAKSQSTDLTAAGLEMKAVIDQMREQVQNVE